MSDLPADLDLKFLPDWLKEGGSPNRYADYEGERADRPRRDERRRDEGPGRGPRRDRSDRGGGGGPRPPKREGAAPQGRSARRADDDCPSNQSERARLSVIRHRPPLSRASRAAPGSFYHPRCESRALSTR